MIHEYNKLAKACACGWQANANSCVHKEQQWATHKHANAPQQGRVKLPDFFVWYLAHLSADECQQMYLAACNDPGTQIRDAIMDVVSARAQDQPE
jgi:hypothetical protein